MRPQDIVILLKVCSFKDSAWQISTIANTLLISISEVSESLNRSKIANLIDYKKKNINRQNLLEFLEHGVHYVFPQEPGAMVRGISTAHSHPFMKKMFTAEIDYVWPDREGDTIGLMIEPFYARQIEAIKQDDTLYLLLSLVDVIRVGRVREIKYAIDELKKQIG